MLTPFSLFLDGPLESEIIVLWTDLTEEKLLGKLMLLPAFALTTIHATVNPVELSRVMKSHKLYKTLEIACHHWLVLN